MGDIFLLLAVVLAIVGICYLVIQMERRERAAIKQQRANGLQPVDAERTLHHDAAIERAYEEQPPNPNEKFLHATRSRSCYPVLRGVHAFLTGVGVVACVILFFVLSAIDGPNATGSGILCAAVIAALLIEYGLFRLIVDAVDVLIVMGQHTVEGKQGAAEPKAGG